MCVNRQGHEVVQKVTFTAMSSKQKQEKDFA
jgi:hypothetical protein